MTTAVRPDLPASDQVEVTLIGPGYGESLILHLGEGIWALVDSCVREPGERSAALTYLESIGVDPGHDVRLVVATHWHDDHVRGLASVVRQCEEAIFCCSAALRSEEFIALSRITPPPGSRFSSGVREMAECIQVLKDRRSHPVFASSARRLLHDQDMAIEAVWALSPADGDIQMALGDFAKAAVDRADGGSISSTWNANLASVVLLLEWTEDSALLGADLEHRAALGRGWHGVLHNTGRPDKLSGLFKVAHHGSVTGHCNATWGHPCPTWKGERPKPLLSAQHTISILAPWKNADKRLPTQDDITRLNRLGAALYMTKDIDAAFGDRSDIENTLASSSARGGGIEPFQPTPGVVRCRHTDGAAWEVESLAI